MRPVHKRNREFVSIGKMSNRLVSDRMSFGCVAMDVSKGQEDTHMQVIVFLPSILCSIRERSQANQARFIVL